MALTPGQAFTLTAEELAIVTELEMRIDNHLSTNYANEDRINFLLDSTKVLSPKIKVELARRYTEVEDGWASFTVEETLMDRLSISLVKTVTVEPTDMLNLFSNLGDMARANLYPGASERGCL